MTVYLGQKALLTESVSVVSSSCKQIGQKGMFRSKVCLYTSIHMCVPGQAGMKGQRPTSRRLPMLSPGRLQPQELPCTAVVFGCVKAPAPRAETPLA